MGIRPRTTRAKRMKKRRCGKCGAHINNQRTRCKKCSGTNPL